MKIKTLSILCSTLLLSANTLAIQPGSTSIDIQALSQALHKSQPIVTMNPDASVVYGGKDITHHG